MKITRAAIACLLLLCSCGPSVNSIAGVYECDFGMGHSLRMDLRSDMSMYWSQGGEKLQWKYEGGEVVLGNRRYKLEGVDLIDNEGRRWVRLR